MPAFLLLLILQVPSAPVDVLHYAFALSLSESKDVIEADARVTVRFMSDSVDSFALDLVGRHGETGMAVSRVTENGADIRFVHEGDRLNLRPGSPVGEGDERTYGIAYEGIPADGLIISQNRHGDRTWFGDNWPNRARHWLSTVDHPSDKATVEFIVTAPNRYQIVGTGELVEETDLDHGRRLTHWRSHVPTATKVMVIGAARFAVQYVDEVAGIPVESWVYPQDRDAGFFDYALAGRILRYFADRIGPYPYEKLANVQSKTRYGGMENAGNIFYSEGSVRGDRSSEGLLAHEIAHQWFGDSVTEKAWFHIWLSEGFATYFAELYLEQTYGADRLREDMRGLRDRVLAYHERNPASPVIDTTITDLNRLLSTNSYQKGAWVLHMLRDELGDGPFWDGIRAYYRDFRDGNALTSDFRRTMERVTGRDLKPFFRQWLKTPGQPDVVGSWSWDGQAVVIELSQAQETLFAFPLTLEIDSVRHRVVINERREVLRIPLDRPPVRVDLDPGVHLLMRSSFTSK